MPNYNTSKKYARIQKQDRENRRKIEGK